MDHNEKSWKDREFTQLRGIEKWRVKKYSYLLSSTHVTPKISAMLPIPSSNLKTRMATTIAEVGKKFTTETRHDLYDMPNRQVQVETKEGKMQRDCGEIRVEHTRETGNHIDTRK